MTKHNKKRNIGIMYELLLRHISVRLIENDRKGALAATRIIEKRFGKDTELYKEFRLFNALAKTSVQNTEIAAAILTEAKNAARRFDQSKIKKEKSMLIRDINYSIKDKSFYYRSISEYRELANIHNMIQEWQKGDTSDLKKMVMLEQSALNHLIKQKSEISLDDLEIKSKETNSDVLIERIMTEKINKKYADFSASQREILQKYALYSSDAGRHEDLKRYLNTQKASSLKSLKNFGGINENSYLSKKIDLVENKINNLDVTILDDATISKFLTLTKLVEEINLGE
tara:strand:+ start:1192 stop:2049 length:858 start_codon:yes stop_codon:yes gene_type:complete